MRKVSVSHGSCGSDILVRQMPRLGSRHPAIYIEPRLSKCKKGTRVPGLHRLLRERIRATFGDQTRNSFFGVGSVRPVRKDFQVSPIIIDRLG
jgi:hypothetical protein